LRSVSSDNFVIVDTTGEAKVIGEADFSSALTTLHEKAIYIQDGQQYHVERLDYDDRKAYVHQVASEYFTDAISYTKIKVLERFDSAPIGPASKNHGEVQVNTQVVGFKKIKFHTMENVGAGKLTLPEQEMHTTAFWLTLPRDLMGSLPYGSTERLDGVNGLANALVAIATLLVMCDARDLGVAVGENEESRTQNSEVRSQNEEGRIQDSGFGIQEPEVRSQNEKPGSSPLAAGVDQSKIQNLKSKIRGSELQVAVVAFEPNIYLYDKYPGGVGLSEPLFRMSQSLLEKTQKLIADCPCASGCPSCVGPIGEVGEKGKEVALEILRRLSVVSGP
jgi:DEAD/DEAH box helicase domain-containing protein